MPADTFRGQVATTAIHTCIDMSRVACIHGVSIHGWLVCSQCAYLPVGQCSGPRIRTVFFCPSAQHLGTNECCSFGHKAHRWRGVEWGDVGGVEAAKRNRYRYGGWPHESTRRNTSVRNGSNRVQPDPTQGAIPRNVPIIFTSARACVHARARTQMDCDL